MQSLNTRYAKEGNGKSFNAKGAEVSIHPSEQKNVRRGFQAEVAWKKNVCGGWGAGFGFTRDSCKLAGTGSHAGAEDTQIWVTDAK